MTKVTSPIPTDLVERLRAISASADTVPVSKDLDGFCFEVRENPLYLDGLGNPLYLDGLGQSYLEQPCFSEVQPGGGSPIVDALNAIFRGGNLRDAAEKAADAIEHLQSQLTVGTAVYCIADNCPKQWAEDWRDWTGFIAGIHYEPRVGLNFTVCDHWPPESNGDLSDGFREGQLAALKTMEQGDA